MGRRVHIVPRVQQIATGIEATRQAFGGLYFDRAKCGPGINKLRRYRYVKNTNNVTGREPLHDDSSHAADALRQFGQMSQQVVSGGYWGNLPQVRRRIL